ncbi:MAG: YlbF family regulator [Planctomycetes bacterium]|nr:YlbF family regulator [Planctomycetota bacterium]
MLMEKAGELGQALGGSSEYRGLVEAERAFEANLAAVELATRVRASTQALAERRAAGQEIAPADIEELKQLQRQVDGNPAIQGLLHAQGAYDKLLAEVNRRITEGLDAARATVAGGRWPVDSGR